jgi:hypothetical protein
MDSSTDHHGGIADRTHGESKPMHYASFAHPLVAAAMAASFLLTSVASSFAQSCDPDTEARLDFIETRLDEGQKHEQWWWRSWLAVYSIGLVYKVVDGATTKDGSNATAAYFTAGKSALGIADLTLRPHVGRHGAAPMRAIPKTTPQYCAERLALAEKSLSQASDASNMRWSWKRHLSSLVLNLGVAVAIDEGWHDEGTAWRDFGVSEASAELSIWTHPTRAYDDYQEYRSKFGGAPAAMAPSVLRFAASPRGLGLVWKF